MCWVCLCVFFSFLVRGDICTCCACKADVFFKGTTLCSCEDNSPLFFSDKQYACTVDWPGFIQMFWCDTIPPPAALQPALHSPWDEERTKTDKLTVVCNLLVKAKWKRSTGAFNLAIEPCSSIFFSTFQKLHWSSTRLTALLGGRLLVPSQVLSLFYSHLPSFTFH